MADEQVITPTEPIVMSQATDIAPKATATIPEGMVDNAPNPEALKAEIERLEKVRQEAEEKALYWRKQKAEARGDFFKERGAEPPKPPPPAEDLGIGPPPAKPNQNEFTDYTEYEKARDKYNDEKIAYEVNRAKIQWDREELRKNQQRDYETKMLALQDKLNEGYRKYNDFEEVARDPTVPITPLMRDMLAELDRPEEVAYYLGKNRAEAIQISRMPPVQVARALAQIELKTASAGGPTPSPPKISSAPPPIKPIGSSNVIDKRLENMSQAEFEAEMQKRTGRRF